MGEKYVQEFGPGSGSIKLFLLGGFQPPRPPGGGPAAPRALGVVVVVINPSMRSNTKSLPNLSWRLRSIRSHIIQSVTQCAIQYNECNRLDQTRPHCNSKMHICQSVLLYCIALYYIILHYTMLYNNYLIYKLHCY